MEDIKIGRRSRSRVGSKSVTTTSRQLVSLSNDRIALIITPPTSQTVTISNDPNVVSLLGLSLYANGSPLVLNVQQHGSLVTESLYAVTSAGTVTVGIAEVFLYEE